MKQFFQKHRTCFRILVGVGVPLVCIAGMLTLYFCGNPFPCMFYKVLHLYCPGCGAGRAATALVHLDLLTAMRQNILFVIFCLPCAYYCLKVYVAFVFGKDVIPWWDAPAPVYTAIGVIFVLFWILRNLPFFPFTLLAPI